MSMSDPSANIGDGQVRVGHGGGGWIKPWQPGQSGNPRGRPHGMKQVREYCRNRSMEAATALCDMAADPGEDGRVRVVAAQTVLTWAWGKPPDYDPREDRPQLTIDTSSLTSEERQFMLAMLRRGIVREADPEPEPQPAATIEARAVE